jgi:HK97 family phage major capsid protein
MPSPKQKLIQERAELVKEGEDLIAPVEGEPKPYSKDETPEKRDSRQKRLDEIEARTEQIDADIEQLAKQEERARKMDTLNQWEPPKPRLPEMPTVTAVEEPKGFTGDLAFGEFLAAVARAEVSQGRSVDPRLVPSDLFAAASGMSSGIPADGGYAVQTDMSATILKRMYEIGQIAGRTFKVPISTNANGTKINAIKESSRATGSRWGGVQGYWIAEGDDLTASKPTLRQVELSLKKLGALVYATDENVADAPQLQRIVQEVVPQELLFLLEDAIINGTGGGMPTGILNSGAVISVSAEAGQGAATLLYDNVLNMWSQMWGPSRANSIWLVDQSIEPQLYKMSLAVGTGGSPVYMPAGGASGAPYATLFNRPVIAHEHGAALGTVGDILLVDLSQYVTIEKGGIQTASSMHVKFISDQMAFRFIYRVDGQSLWDAALTPKSGGNDLSPFLSLATRS